LFKKRQNWSNFLKLLDNKFSLFRKIAKFASLGWHSRSADGSGGQLGSLGILAYAMSNIGFKDSDFCTEGDDM
jgi:hypothetical protein